MHYNHTKSNFHLANDLQIGGLRDVMLIATTRVRSEKIVCVCNNDIPNCYSSEYTVFRLCTKSLYFDWFW